MESQCVFFRLILFRPVHGATQALLPVSALMVVFRFAGMEDAHTTLLKLDPSSGNSFFAVFDGHGGRQSRCA